MVGAVAFLMFIFFVGLYDTDQCNNDTDDCYYNTNDAHKNFQHQLCTFRYIFHSYHLPKYRKFSKCEHFGERRTATRFGNTLYEKYNIILAIDAI